MKQYIIDSTYTASEEQTEFVLRNLSESSSVFLNGELQELGTDYSINEEGFAEFLTAAEEGDEINIVSSVELSDRSSILSYGSKDKIGSLFKRFSSDQKLEYNNKYVININIKDEDFKWSFQSKLQPFFSTIKLIRNDIGDFISDYQDEKIESFIYSNSKDVVSLVNELLEDDIENVTITENTDGSYETNDRAVKDWVRYKSEIDLIYAKYFGISADYGSKKKSIGDISIEKSTKLPYIDQLLGRLRSLFDEADMKIRGYNTVVSAVKAGDNYTYEDWDRELTW